ncbi:hypothetical protein ACFO6R_16370 [Eubacterium multiforme]|uniref:DMSO/TMAO reductase YedYZ heme-binding membrane subunit n=1 Tax=Eubacterium multiforme TaxID=83339 RepID=A0ABT9UTC6_9FIRM|nr:hypothetical protein [Eubacterium multiforme]MDQ0149560.1 DMSO/TMAO reductase YedYZ heme-binding membrane subunit [Eubacterium multiforme]
MIVIILILLLSILSIKYSKQIKKYSIFLYVLSVIISIAFIVILKLNLTSNFPVFINKYFINIFSRGTISLALFTIVMFTGVLNNSSNIKKKLMSIRGELSIIACIITLGHNILYGMFYFPTFFTNPSKLSTFKLIATSISLLMIILMLPLMITSFRFVRKKMRYKTWKNIQRTAYLFYGLIYIHILFLFIPKLQSGKFLDLLIYSLIFLSYYPLRIFKYIKDKNKVKLNRLKTNTQSNYQ